MKVTRVLAKTSGRDKGLLHFFNNVRHGRRLSRCQC
ncbi:hypothetical protein Pint_09429 [Pistacia integerrima]|uniref:Uncharacterized protein n=1 Tax=Pistacia integerrima TaxID=434235 RepID=A0ACC0XFZ3_9ROSI|nr:hypothetical protein Pint_09429 [Pistacia integerrima]